MNDVDLDAAVARDELVYAVFVPSAAFIRKELFDLAEEAGLEGDGGKAVALVHACLFRSDLVRRLRSWGEIERFATLGDAIAWCSARNLRFHDTSWSEPATAVMLKALRLCRQKHYLPGGSFFGEAAPEDDEQ